MCQVVEAKALRQEIEAVRAASEVNDAQTRMDEKVTAVLDQARKYRNFIEVFEELKKEKTHSTINILTQ